MIEINGVKWYRTTEDKPKDGQKIVLLNRVFEDGDVMADINYNKWSDKYQGINCNGGDSSTKIELSNYQYWCDYVEFFNPYIEAGLNVDLYSIF